MEMTDGIHHLNIWTEKTKDEFALQDSLNISSVFVDRSHQPPFKVFKSHLKLIKHCLLNMKKTSVHTCYLIDIIIKLIFIHIKYQVVIPHNSVNSVIINICDTVSEFLSSFGNTSKCFSPNEAESTIPSMTSSSSGELHQLEQHKSSFANFQLF